MSLTDDIFAKRGTWQLFQTVAGYDLSTAKTGHVDQQGRLWLRLPKVLLCTDGRHEIKSHHHDVLTGQHYSRDGFSRDDRYWFITPDHRLLALSLDNGTIEDHTDKVPRLDDVYWLWCSPHEDILFAFPGTLIRYDGQKAVAYAVPGNETGKINSAGISPEGNLWFTSYLGLHAVNGTEITFYDLPYVGKSMAWNFLAGQDNILWTSIGSRILYLQNGRVKQEAINEETFFPNYTPLLIDDEKNAWFSVRFRGTIVVNPNGSVLFPFEDTPAVSWPRCVVQDKTRAFWLIGAGNGIIRYDPQMLNVVQHGYMETSTMGGDGKLRVTAASKGLLEYDGSTIRTLCDNTPPHCVYLSCEPNNNIYISSENGFYLFDSKHSALRGQDHIPGLAGVELSTPVLNLARDAQGSTWLNSRKVLYRLDGQALKAFPHEELGFGSRLIMFRDSKARLWFLGRSEWPLLQFGPNGFAVIREQLGDCVEIGEEEMVTCCTEDSEDNLWFGTSNGNIFRYGMESDTAEKMMSLADDPTVRDIRIDASGRRWFSTDNGLTIADDHHHYRMTEAALLPSRIIVATYAFNDDRILIITELGICEYRPNRDVAPQVFIAKVVSNYVHYFPEKPIVCETRPGLHIYLTAFNMKAAPLKYQIRLSGYSDEWADTWKEEFHYTSLPVGTYRFEARAIDQDLMTSDIAALDIEITQNIHENLIAELKGELRGAKDFAANIIRSVNDIIIVLNTDGNIATANASALRLLGYKQSDLVGKSADMLFPEGSTVSLDTRHIAKLKKEGCFRTRETELQTRDGTHVPVIVSITCMYDRVGNLQGYVLDASDITEYKQMQTEMLQSQKMENLGMLAGGIAHDLNNLLNVMMGNTELVLTDMGADSAGYKYLSEIVSAGKQAAKLCSKMLAYSGKKQPRREPLDLSTIVKHNADLLRSSIPRGINLDYKLEPNLPKIVGDEVQLMQIVLNLVINAVQAIGNQQGTISLTTRLSAPPDDSPHPEQYVLMEIKDSGCGMDTETLARIFEPFFSTKLTGRGLGLSAIHGIVKSHGGEINVESAPKEGTAFKIYIPVAETT